MLHRNEIKLEQHGSVTLLDIQGDITGFSEPFLNEAYKNVDKQGTSNILLKTERDIYINSGGIAVLIQILAQTKPNKTINSSELPASPITLKKFLAWWASPGLPKSMIPWTKPWRR